MDYQLGTEMGYGMGGIGMLFGTVLLGLAIVALVKYIRS